ncbi:DNA topoisomerase 3 [Catellicoccus marimammalium]|uniref:DNA topoisomerase n=1 Tax=Catellicoccus marimammalium M35/04/3 TaxID=1234409 RepID=K8Z749_9ENTE|nr:DNA topoisomerase 3 [Catellicoccus marimammalium]EKU26854.1 DNA topoisomerase III [Catellicoccus marimammalium M35/04/3]
MKQLVIAEKPSVASDLARVLHAKEKKKHYYEGKSTIVTWGYGHLLTLKMPEDYKKEWKTWSMDTLPMLPKQFLIQPLPKTKGQLQAIRQLCQRKDIKEVVIATDAGREGELVARWILQYVRYKGPVKRLWISSQTDKAIKEGFAHLKPAKMYDDLFYSAQARSEADWLIGLNVSRALTIQYGDQLSAGRVQTPTLALVRKREKEIESFRPKEQFTVELSYQGHPLTSRKPLVFSKKETAEKVKAQLQKETAVVKEKKVKVKKQWAPLLYDLTELQQVANQRYGFSAKKTLNLVQSLYEHHKIVSYPRTDSKYLPTDLESSMKERLQAVAKEFSLSGTILQKGKVQQRKVFNDQKVSDHYGLIPTEVAPNISRLSQDEWKIYQLITKRFLNLFYPPYEAEEQTFVILLGDQNFQLKQEKVLEQGWKEKEEGVSSLHLSLNQELPIQIKVVSSMTKPKSRLTEGQLLAQMEKHHLGTPATRAEIIEKLVNIQYLERQGREFIVTPKGKQLLTLVNESLVRPELTEEWELHLQKIEKGKEKKEQFIQKMKKEATRLVTEIKQSEKEYKDFALTTKKCPECSGRLREKKTKQGVFYVCSNPECHYKRRKDLKVSNHRCPQCHKKMVIVEGEKGAYFKCQSCSLTEKIPDKKAKKQKMTKQEERRLMKKYSEKAPAENPFASALENFQVQD